LEGLSSNGEKAILVGKCCHCRINECLMFRVSHASSMYKTIGSSSWRTALYYECSVVACCKPTISLSTHLPPIFKVAYLSRLAVSGGSFWRDYLVTEKNGAVFLNHVLRLMNCSKQLCYFNIFRFCIIVIIKL
jgi:hypothetical protein